MKKPALIPVGMKYSQTGGDRNRDSKGKHLDEYRDIVNLLNHVEMSQKKQRMRCLNFGRRPSQWVVNRSKV
jgi:hypothetical protein